MLIGTRHNGTKAAIDICEFGDSASESGEFDESGEFGDSASVHRICSTRCPLVHRLFKNVI